MEATQKHCFLPRKGLDFGAQGHQNPSKIDPKPIKNAKVEAKSSRKAVLEFVETDFGTQDSDLGGQEGDFGDQNAQSYFR